MKFNFTCTFAAILAVAVMNDARAADDALPCAATFESLVETEPGEWTAYFQIKNISDHPQFVGDRIHGVSYDWKQLDDDYIGGAAFQMGPSERHTRFRKLSPQPLRKDEFLESGRVAPNRFVVSVPMSDGEGLAERANQMAKSIDAEITATISCQILEVSPDKSEVTNGDMRLKCKQHPATIRIQRFGEPEPEQPTGYDIVVSSETQKDARWSQVVAVLKAKHTARVLSFDKDVNEVLPSLTERMPRHIAFVATPKEATREFVAAVHRLTRKLDDDPYTDALWGIVTGFDAQNALNIVQTREPLSVKKVAAGTDVELAACTEGIWYCELKKNRMVRKLPDGAAVEERGPDDTTQALAATLADYHADLFVTSGHATERDWQIGFAYRNGSFRSKEGRLFGYPTLGKAFEIKSDNPKVYLAVGNCLMGNIDSQDAMALAWLNSAGVRQMVGYTVLTWYGYAGWGMLDYYVEQPGRFNMAEAFFANQQAIVHRLETEFPEIARENPEPGKTKGRGDGAGLLHDRDVLAFYGDPKWDARLAPGPLRWERSLVEKDGKWTLTITPKTGADTFKPVNKNGSQRGGRPIVAMLPRRISGKVEVESGADLKPVITDDFVLVPLPAGEVKEKYEVVFREVD